MGAVLIRILFIFAFGWCSILAFIFSAYSASGTIREQRQQLTHLLTCRTALSINSSEIQQRLTTRLRFLSQKYEVVSSTIPDHMQANMGISIPDFYNRMIAVAENLSAFPDEAQTQIHDLERQFERALVFRRPLPRGTIPYGKAELVRNLTQDWDGI